MVLAYEPSVNGHAAAPAGFSMPRRALVLTFAEDSPYHGAEVRCRASLPLRDALAVDRMKGGSEEEIQEAYRIFGEHVVLGWNLVDDDGEPLPYTVGAWLDQPYMFLIAVLSAWKAEMQGVPAPLPSPSPNGQPSPEPGETTAAS